MPIRDFAAKAERPDFEVVAQTLTLSDALLHGVQTLPRALGALVKDSVYGVALLSDRNTRLLEPTILLTDRIARGVATSFEATRIPGLSEALPTLLGQDTPWISKIRLMGVAPLEEHIVPGDSVTAGRRGTVGAGVRWASNYGFLTAGHVAALNSSALCGGVPVGSVVYSNDPAGHGPKIEDDVAVIQLLSSSVFTQNISGLGQAGPGDNVSIQSPSISAPAQIQGYATFFHSPGSNATYGELYMTHKQVTQPGHSGAAVLDSAGNLLGHVIGGSAGNFSYIQDIHFQLGIIDSQPGFSGITVW